MANSQRNNLIYNFSSLSFIQIVNFLLSLIVIPHVIRNVGADGFGVIAVAQVVMFYLAAFTDYGFNQTATRDIAVNKSDNQKVSRIFFTVLASKIIVCLLSFVLLMILVLVVPFFNNHFKLYLLAFAFVMLNIYLCFAEFLIIWSGNVPDEIPWYLNRIHGGWWVVCSADFICHWLIPFVLLLSRDLKRNKQKMIWLTCFMIFARCLDMFWLIEPNFADAAGNLHIAGNVGILAYITVPVAVITLWAAHYMTQLQARPLINVNDPHVEEMLEPEHAH